MNIPFFSLKKPYLAFSITVLLLITLVFIGQSSLFNTTQFNTALTLDFALTIPFIYFLLIRKSKTPKTTIVPIFILGLVAATYTIPQENQSLLSFIKTWFLPIVEILVGTFVILKVRKLVLEFKNTKNESLDFFDALKLTTKQLLPNIPANLLAMEIAVFYYGIFKWRKIKLKQNEYTYHKNSGTPTLLSALILLIAIETVSIHFLLIKWSWIAATIALILSVYSGFQLLGFLKSLLYRPYTITNKNLNLKYGVLGEATIPLNKIERISLFSKDLEKGSEIKKLSPLGGLETHNMLIEVKEQLTLFGLYGSKKQYSKIAFFVDNKAEFLKQIENQIK